MTAIFKSIQKFENHFDKYAKSFVFYHPYLAFFAMFIGLPIFILFSVSFCTTLIALPLSLIFGWI